MNSISIFFYIVSVVAWWAGFNYAAARASTARRRKLLSTAAALALAWPFAFIALTAALATKFAATIMIAVGDHINNTWDAAVSDPDDEAITVLTPTGTAVRIQRENTEHGSASSANNTHENDDTANSEEARPALADNMPLTPPPPPPAANTADDDTASQADAGCDAAAETTDNAANKDGDETVTIQKVALSDLL